MKISNLKRANDHEVEEWLVSQLDLNPYQKSRLREMEIVRFSSFYFYKREKDIKLNILWRLTIIFWVLYIVCLMIIVPIKWMITGKSYLGRNYLDNYHYKWQRKIGI